MLGKGNPMRNHGEDEEAEAIIRGGGEGISAAESTLSPNLFVVDGGGKRKKKRSGMWLVIRKLKFNKESLRWRWKFLSSAFKWKRIKMVDDALFKIASVFEAIVLVATVGFFYLCCGCNF